MVRFGRCVYDRETLQGVPGAHFMNIGILRMTPTFADFTHITRMVPLTQMLSQCHTERTGSDVIESEPGRLTGSRCNHGRLLPI